MHRGHFRVGFGRDDGGGLHLLAVRSGPGFPEAGEGDRPAANGPREIRALAAAMRLPFIEPIRRKQTTASLHGVAERRLVVDRLGPRIDQEREALWILDP